MNAEEWSALLESLRTDIGVSTACLLGGAQIELTNGTFLYTVPNRTVLDILEKEGRRDVLERAIREKLGPDIEIKLEIREVSLEHLIETHEIDRRSSEKLRRGTTIPMGFDWFEVREEFGEGSFCVGGWNRLAHAAAQELVSGNEQTVCLVAPTGLGKTHLGQNILHQLKSQGMNVGYVPSPTYMKNAVQSMIERTDALAFYLTLNAIFFDDLQFWASRMDKKSWDCFKVTLEAVLARGIRLIVAMHERPGTYGFSGEVFGRIAEGLTIPIREPNQSERLELIEFWAGRMNSCAIPTRVMGELAAFELSPRVISGALKTLNLLWQNDDAPESLAAWVSENYAISRPTLNTSSIINAVAEVSGLKPGAITSKSRKGPQVQARHIVMYLMCELLGLTQSQIAREFNQDPSTVNSAMRNLEERIKGGETNASTLLRESKRMLKGATPDERSGPAP